MWDFMSSWGGAWCGPSVGYGGHHGWFGGWGVPFFHGPFGLLLVLLLVFFLVRWLWPVRRPAVNGPGALDELKRRYAAGEITEEEFTRMREQVR